MIKNVIFDVGAVLVDWSPRYLYREVIGDESRMEKFLSEVCTPEWNYSLDFGRPWEDARAELVQKFPEHTDWIDMYWHRWLDMVAGPIHESVDILMDLKRRGYPLYALSNWHQDKWQDAICELPYLRLFDGRVVSGEEGIAKPDPAIYTLLLNRFSLNPRECLFIDDRAENVAGARNVGIEAVQFISPRQLEQDLVRYGVYPDEGNEAEETRGCGEGCTCHVR